MVRGIRFGWLSLMLLLLGCGGGAEATPTPVVAPPTATPVTAPTPGVVASPTPVVVAPTATPTTAAEEPRYGGILIAGVWTTRVEDQFLSTHGLDKPGLIVGGPPHVQSKLFTYRRESSPDGPIKFIGVMAESWSYDNTNTVLTIKLRPNMKWHDGTAVTAQQLETYFSEHLNPPEGWISPRRGILGPVVEEVQATDVRTLVIRQKRPSVSFLGNLTFDIFATHIPLGQTLKSPVGAGAFIHVSSERDQVEEVRKNPGYFEKDFEGRQLPFLDGIKRFAFLDRTLFISALRIGRIKYADRTQTPLVTQAVDLLQKDVPGIFLDSFAEAPFALQLKPTPPFDDLRVREAISLWLDRKQFVDIGFNGRGSFYDTGVLPVEVGGAWGLPPEEIMNWPGFRQVDSTGKVVTSLEELAAKRGELRKDPRDRERAKQLLTEAGIKQGTVSFEVATPSYEGPRSGPVHVAQLKELFGATWPMKLYPPGVEYIRDLAALRYNVMTLPGCGYGVDDPISGCSLGYVIGHGNIGIAPDPSRVGWPADNPNLVRLKQLYDDLDITFDPVKRRELAWEWQREILRWLGRIPTHHGTGFGAYWPEVRGIEKAVSHSHPPSTFYEVVWLAR